VFVDTAGLREASDAVEQEGVRRSHEAVARADVILHVIDTSEAQADTDVAFLRDNAGRKRIVIGNKCDLPRRLQWPGDAPAVIDVSCTSGLGLEGIKDAIQALVWSGGVPAGMLQAMINARHQDALRRAREATERAAEALTADATLELVALELRLAVNAVGEIVGQTATEDLLDSIFSQFCLGK
jgi:tRNA modification GTPase